MGNKGVLPLTFKGSTEPVTCNPSTWYPIKSIKEKGGSA